MREKLLQMKDLVNKKQDELVNISTKARDFIRQKKKEWATTVHQDTLKRVVLN